jgi:ureidoglycolate lyase
MSQQEAELQTRSLPVRQLDTENFAAFGQVIEPTFDGKAFDETDAQLHLSEGTPRLYIMQLDGKGLRFRQITRHRRVTQCLMATGSTPWFIAVAPPKDLDVATAEPKLEDIVAFEIPPGTAIKLHTGTWHAGPYFLAEKMDFLNLELADTNQIDHHSCFLDKRYGVQLEFAASKP